MGLRSLVHAESGLPLTKIDHSPLHGYDYNFVLNQRPGDSLTFAARAYDPRTGRVIDCFTTEPAVQVYTSNGMNGSIVGSSGTTYRQTEAFTLETQHFPDSPNKPNFPTTELKPGQDFHSTMIFRFAATAALRISASGRDQASLRCSRSNVAAMILSNLLRFCFALSLGSSESSASNISISGIGVSLPRFNSWSSFTSSSSVIRVFSDKADVPG
jgi:hypothetical protein